MIDATSWQKCARGIVALLVRRQAHLRYCRLHESGSEFPGVGLFDGPEVAALVCRSSEDGAHQCPRAARQQYDEVMGASVASSLVSVSRFTPTRVTPPTPSGCSAAEP